MYDLMQNTEYIINHALCQVWNKLDNMNEQLAIKRSMQLMNLFGTIGSSKELLNEEPQVLQIDHCCTDRTDHLHGSAPSEQVSTGVTSTKDLTGLLYLVHVFAVVMYKLPQRRAAGICSNSAPHGLLLFRSIYK